jgi:hypothetical protein
VPEDYHEFADVFSKSCANTLAPHHPYDLQINLEDGAQPLVSTIYSLSQVELESLWTFIDKHLAIGFIRPLTSPHGAPILFIHKKDGSLRLCVNFRGLNCLTKKDCCPLPLISDLLDSLYKARRKKKQTSAAAQLSPPAPCNYPGSQSPYLHGSPQDCFWLQRTASQQSEPSLAPPATSPALEKEPIPPPEHTHTSNMLDMLLRSCEILCDWTGKTWSSPRNQMHIARYISNLVHIATINK